MVARQPAVLTVPPAALVEKAARIEQSLGMDKVGGRCGRGIWVVRVSFVEPAVLGMDEVDGRCGGGLHSQTHTHTHAATTQGTAAPLMAKQPEFFEVSTERLGTRTRALAAVLGPGVTAGDALSALARLPPPQLFQMLDACARPRVLVSRVRAVVELLQVCGDGRLVMCVCVCVSGLPGV